MKVAFYAIDCALEGAAGPFTVANLETLTTSTHDTFFLNESFPTTGAIAQGVLNVSSTESGVFCTAMIIGGLGPVPNGVAINMVRFNPHPGAVE